MVLPMWRAIRRPVECPHPQLAKLFPFVAAFVIGWSVALLSLSRCYAPSTMLVVAIGAAFVNVLERHVNPPQKLVRLDRSHLTTLMGVCVLLLIGFYCFTRAVT